MTKAHAIGGLATQCRENNQFTRIGKILRTHSIYKILLFLVIAASPVVKEAGAAEVWVEKGDVVRVHFSGGITKKDADDLTRVLAFLRNESAGKDFIKDSPVNKFLVINSPGGEVDAAMRIGTLVRSYRMAVAVPAKAKCMSSCVYIVAGGLVRWLYGDVGIHRPYFATAPSESFDAAMKKVVAESKTYFSRMNVSEQLADAMFSTPPDDVHVLSDRELKNYWLGREDMAYAEDVEIANATRLKLSRQEYMRRQKLATAESNSKCTYDDEMMSCMVNVYGKYGLIEAKTAK
ncbi:ATP-dependent Clp protease proteolytic subunit [Pandoraea eparura]|uniref:ATP-dependent Clp protease proteolytic subunit n=1 Tax=Pandoraea eparura TaxID=2508291 RepID=UPI00123F67D5|nr:ATP-dependent Clp protease proteolytic subunit [Pandoraea eparura]